MSYPCSRRPNYLIPVLSLMLVSLFACGVAAAGPVGDFDCDGDLDIGDIDLLVGAIAGFSTDLTFDLNGDGLVTLMDITCPSVGWLAVAGSVNLPSGNPYLEGDANLDGLVDGFDFLIWNAFKFMSTAAWSQADFNADGATDASDFFLWSANRFTASFAGSPATHRVLFDEISRVLWLDTRGSDMVAFLVEGGPAASIDSFRDGVLVEGQRFYQTYFVGFEQWVREGPLSVPGFVGLFPMATYPTGTTVADFGDWFAAGDAGGVASGVVEGFCDTGNVNFGVGSVAEVLSANGETGHLEVMTSEPIELALSTSPSGPAQARYCLWVWLGNPMNPVELAGRGSSLGCISNPTPLQPGMAPQPFRCLRGGVPPIVCRSTPELPAPSTAPWSVPRPSGVQVPITFTIQGVIEDTGAANATGFSICNRVTLTVTTP